MTVKDLKAELAKYDDKLEIVWHDADGCAWFQASISEDGTCNDDETVVRISLKEAT